MTADLDFFFFKFSRQREDPWNLSFKILVAAGEFLFGFIGFGCCLVLFEILQQLKYVLNLRVIRWGDLFVLEGDKDLLLWV